jgi:hypothetical protein
MIATATSADGNIRARMTGRDEVEVTFEPATFDQYDEDNLRRQLEQLCELLWVALDRERTEAYRRTLGLSNDELAMALRHPKDDRRRRYEADLAAIEVEGVAPSGMLRIRATGPARWCLDMTAGAMYRLGEQRFVAELNSALRALLAEREVRVTMVKAEHYDLGLPRRWQNLLKELTNP